MKTEVYPGTIQVFKSPHFSTPDIVCFLSQWDFVYFHRKYRSVQPYNDTRENRLSWFCQCIEHLLALNIKFVGLPFQIGGGFAGEDWNLYIDAVEDLSRRSKIEFIIFVPSFIAK